MGHVVNCPGDSILSEGVAANTLNERVRRVFECRDPRDGLVRLEGVERHALELGHSVSALRRKGCLQPLPRVRIFQRNEAGHVNVNSHIGAVPTSYVQIAVFGQVAEPLIAVS